MPDNLKQPIANAAVRAVFTGGGTLGSVTPLLAVYQELRRQRPDAECLWLSTLSGPEHGLIERYGIRRVGIPSGKLRRYWSWSNVTDGWNVVRGFFAARKILREFRPTVVLTAGGYVGVPVVRAAVRLHCPVLLHQPDVELGLANRLSIKSASIITVSFAESLRSVPKQKTVLTGNPIRADLLGGLREAGLVKLKLNPDLPTLLVMGGSTGAAWINELLAETLERLLEFCQVIHITGGRAELNISNPRYKPFAFVDQELRDYYAAADLVISRAGASALAELTALRKPAILIPMPNSPQEQNAAVYFKANAALVVQQDQLDAASFVQAVEELLKDPSQLQSLGRTIAKMMPLDAAQRIVRMML